MFQSRGVLKDRNDIFSATGGKYREGRSARKLLGGNFICRSIPPDPQNKIRLLGGFCFAVEFLMNFPELFVGYVGVNLGRSNGGVAEQGLHRTNVRTVP